MTIQFNNGSSIPYILKNDEMPIAMVPKSSIGDEDSKKLEKLSPAQRYQTNKNRYFNLDMKTNEYHHVMQKYQKAKYAVFTDMIENSMLDIMVVS